MIDSAAIAKAREALSGVDVTNSFDDHKTLSDFINEVEAAMKAEPVAWGVFAKADAGIWRLQHPVRFAKAAADEDHMMYAGGVQCKTEPLYANPLAAQQRPPHDQKFYKPCDNHKDLPFTINIEYTPPVQTVCPHCEKEQS